MNDGNHLELVVGSLNIQGQTSFNETKQKQIEHFIKYHDIDILHCQEIEISPKTFETCKYISSNYDIIQNNSPANKYGTASIVRKGLIVENIKCDTKGRVILFDIGSLTFSNFYLHSGNSKEMKADRDNYISEVIPQMLVNRKVSGILAADFNCIIDRKDSLRNAEQKMSSSLKRFVSVS